MKSILLFFFFILMSSCSKNLLDNNYSHTELYNEFWHHVDQHYIFFDIKNVNWLEVYGEEISRINDGNSELKLFDVMESSLLKLKDNHVRLYAPFKKSKTYDFRNGYNIAFSLDVVKANYLDGDFQERDDILYAIKNDIGYIYISKLKHNNTLGNVIKELNNNGIEKLIIDVRSNPGGNSNGIPNLLGHFVKEKQIIGSYVEKNGPGHNDNTDPISVFAEPNFEWQIEVPTYVLCDRGAYSAATYLVTMFKGLNNVTTVGQVSGGGAGGNSGFELSNGWVLTVSVSDFLDKEGNLVENGVDVDIKIENSFVRLEQGIDDVLDFVFGN